jgi:subtilisin family serine protease
VKHSVRTFVLIVVLFALSLTFVAAQEATSAPAGGYLIGLRESRPGVISSESAMMSMSSLLTSQYGAQVSASFPGFSILVANVPAGSVDRLRRDPRIAFIEPNLEILLDPSMVSEEISAAAGQVIPTGVRRIFATSNPNLDIDGRDDSRVNVDVAIVDTGIAPHPDLRIAGHVTCTSIFGFFPRCNLGGRDGHGHGTHVAGTVGALDNTIGVVGVAPGARLWGVKVLGDNGSGFTSQIIAGLEWVRARAATIEVVNMSLGGRGTNASMDRAIANLVNAGVVVVVAAGNDYRDAAGYTPANSPDAITVSALADFNGLPGGRAAATCRRDEDDTSANFSNFGRTIEIAAPGVCINSTWLRNGYSSISGTSMAAPHVAGAAALLASRANPNTRADVLAIRNTLMSSGNLNWVDQSPDRIRERLLDVSSTRIYRPVFGQ